MSEPSKPIVADAPAPAPAPATPADTTGSEATTVSVESELGGTEKSADGVATPADGEKTDISTTGDLDDKPGDEDDDEMEEEDDLEVDDEEKNEEEEKWEEIDQDEFLENRFSNNEYDYNSEDFYDEVKTTEKNEDTIKRIEEIRGALKEIENKKTILNEQIPDLQKQLVNLIAKQDQIKARDKRFNEEEEELKHQLKTAEEEGKAFEQPKGEDEEIGNLQGQLDNLTTKQNQIKARDKRFNEEEEELKHQLKTAEEEGKAFEQPKGEDEEISDLENQLAKLNDVDLPSEEEYNNLKARQDGLDAKTNEFKININKLNHDDRQIETQLDQIDREMQTLNIDMDPSIVSLITGGKIDSTVKNFNDAITTCNNIVANGKKDKLPEEYTTAATSITREGGPAVATANDLKYISDVCSRYGKPVDFGGVINEVANNTKLGFGGDINKAAKFISSTINRANNAMLVANAGVVGKNVNNVIEIGDEYKEVENIKPIYESNFKNNTKLKELATQAAENFNDGNLTTTNLDFSAINDKANKDYKTVFEYKQQLEKQELDKQKKLSKSLKANANFKYMGDAKTSEYKTFMDTYGNKDKKYNNKYVSESDKEEFDALVESNKNLIKYAKNPVKSFKDTTDCHVCLQNIQLNDYRITLLKQKGMLIEALNNAKNEATKQNIKHDLETVNNCLQQARNFNNHGKPVLFDKGINRNGTRKVNVDNFLDGNISGTVNNMFNKINTYQQNNFNLQNTDLNAPKIIQINKPGINENEEEKRKAKLANLHNQEQQLENELMANEESRRKLNDDIENNNKEKEKNGKKLQKYDLQKRLNDARKKKQDRENKKRENDLKQQGIRVQISNLKTKHDEESKDDDKDLGSKITTAQLALNDAIKKKEDREREKGEKDRKQQEIRDRINKLKEKHDEELKGDDKDLGNKITTTQLALNDTTNQSKALDGEKIKLTEELNELESKKTETSKTVITTKYFKKKKREEKQPEGLSDVITDDDGDDVGGGGGKEEEEEDVLPIGEQQIPTDHSGKSGDPFLLGTNFGGTGIGDKGNNLFRFGSNLYTELAHNPTGEVEQSALLTYNISTARNKFGDIFNHYMRSANGSTTVSDAFGEIFGESLESIPEDMRTSFFNNYGDRTVDEVRNDPEFLRFTREIAENYFDTVIRHNGEEMANQRAEEQSIEDFDFEKQIATNTEKTHDLMVPIGICELDNKGSTDLQSPDGTVDMNKLKNAKDPIHTSAEKNREEQIQVLGTAGGAERATRAIRDNEDMHQKAKGGSTNNLHPSQTSPSYQQATRNLGFGIAYSQINIQASGPDSPATVTFQQQGASQPVTINFPGPFNTTQFGYDSGNCRGNGAAIVNQMERGFAEQGDIQRSHTFALENHVDGLINENGSVNRDGVRTFMENTAASRGNYNGSMTPEDFQAFGAHIDNPDLAEAMLAESYNLQVARGVDKQIARQNLEANRAAMIQGRNERINYIQNNLSPEEQQQFDLRPMVAQQTAQQQPKGKTQDQEHDTNEFNIFDDDGTSKTPPSTPPNSKKGKNSGKKKSAEGHNLP